MATAERVLFRRSPAMFRNRPVLFLVWVCLIPLYGVGLVLLIVWLLRCLGTSLIVSDRRSTLRTGILSKRTNEVRHEDVRNVTVSQSVFQRIFGTGDVGISTAGHAGVEVSIGGISNPDAVRSVVEAYRDGGADAARIAAGNRRVAAGANVAWVMAIAALVVAVPCLLVIASAVRAVFHSDTVIIETTPPVESLAGDPQVPRQVDTTVSEQESPTVSDERLLPDARQWKSADGKFSVDARFVRRTSTGVVLLKENGKEIEVPYEKLSRADRNFLIDQP